MFVRVERLAATLPPADAEILRRQITANHAAIEDTQAKFHSARQHVHEVLRQEPFDVEAMRAATAQTRAARLNFDQTVQGSFRRYSCKNHTRRTASAGQLAPRAAKDRERQTVVSCSTESLFGRGLKALWNALGWEDKGGGNDSLGAPVLDNAAEYMRIHCRSAAACSPATSRSLGSISRLPIAQVRAIPRRRKRQCPRSTGGAVSVRAN